MNVMKTLIEKLVDGENLTEDKAENAMKHIMSGKATPAQIGAFLTALRIKGETVEEVSAFARTMRQFAQRIKPKVNGMLTDTCGTGGDKIKTFNVSTAAMFVAAGAGVPIAKHGNRSVTSKAGSADVLEVLGVRIDLQPKDVEQCIENIGIGFMFAPIFHRAMKYAVGPRREIGIRTVFNILGPLTNPAEAEAQLVGVYDATLTEKLARVLKKLECKRAMVVYGLDGLDEISTLGETQISELRNGRVRTYTIAPEDYGIPRARPRDIRGKNAYENARIMVKVLRGEKGPRRDITLLNAAATIFVSGKASSLRDGLELAENSVDSGEAYQKLVQLVNATGGNKELLKAFGGGT